MGYQHARRAATFSAGEVGALAFLMTVCHRLRMRLPKSRRCIALVVPLGLALVSTCTPPKPPPPLPPPVAPTPPLSEEELKAVERPDIAITDVNEVPSPDHHSVTVSGTLLNRGRGATREVYVHVEAINRDGAVVQAADSEPTTEAIPAGSTATFAVKLENRADIDRYDVKAVAR